MDPCPFIRLVIGNLALKFPSSNNPPNCYCKIKIKNHTTHITDIINIITHDHDDDVIINQADNNQLQQASFTFKKTEFDKVVEKGVGLKVEVYSGRKGNPVCGYGSGKLIGVVVIGLDSAKSGVVKNGWVDVGDLRKRVGLYLNVRVEPDPRFVFEFDGEPECSPQVFQVNGNVRQAVFTCKFSVRNSGDRNLRSGSSITEPNNTGNWLRTVRNEKEKPVKERKGWSITIHDLSGSPVAMASMVTPFVPSNGTNDVRRSNPGAWLILRPGHNTWKPWGRLEAWRDSTGLGYRFELLPDATITGLDPITLSNSTISSKNGGKFTIDVGTGASPMTTPSGSFDSCSGSGSGSDFWSGSWAQLMYQGFVMSSKVSSKPEVEIGVQHVTCTEDAAAFVALAAAVDLSVDACLPFSKKLRKELRHDAE